MKKEKTNEQYSLYEAIADIAFIAGRADYYGADSRTDISEFIRWAEEFERINKGVEWGVIDRDYIDEIHAFATRKIKEGLLKRV